MRYENYLGRGYVSWLRYDYDYADYHCRVVWWRLSQGL